MRAEGASDTSPVITVDAAQTLGPSRLATFYSVQGRPLQAADEQGSNEGSREWERQVWKHLGLLTDGEVLFSGEDGPGIRVLRDPPQVESHFLGPLGPGQDLYLDTAVFDAVWEDWASQYGRPRGPWSQLDFVPRALSSNPDAEDYHAYPPADLVEWQEVIVEAVRHTVGLMGEPPSVFLFGEIESSFSVLCADGVACTPTSEPHLGAYLDLYIATHHALKSAHPNARLVPWCPSNPYAEDLRAALPGGGGLEDFLRMLSEYNRGAGENAVTPEVVCWQGYSWRDEPLLAPMVAHVQEVLAASGFDPSLPQVLAGWSRGWLANPTWEQGTPFPPHLFVPALLSNVITHLDPGGVPGPIEQAFYYTWNFSEQMPSGLVSTRSLVRTVHDDIFYDFTYPGEGVPDIAASDANCLSPASYAFDALRRMREGELVAVDAGASGVDAMATSDDTGLHVLLSNYQPVDVEATLALTSLPETLDG